MNNKSLISINDYSKDQILQTLDIAEEFEQNPNQRLLEGKVIATLFFEPSTRTRLSFESSINRLGGQVIGFASKDSSSVQKGESLKDTIKTVSKYCDLIVMRHPLEGSARYASEVASVPVINAGDGANQHPTQTMLDLYSIRKTQNTLNNLNLFLVGDLKYGRTVHSLLMAMSHFNTNYHFVSPTELKIPEEYKMFLSEHNLNYKEHLDFTDIISEADIIYMTRIQRERFSDPMEYEKTKNSFMLRRDMLEGTKENLKVLHPLPRINEINEDVDESRQSYYFTQALNGVYTRMAIMSSILGLKQ
ncbi:MAG: aspartate carbamoyltransferase [Bacteroidales bacterium]